MSKADYLKAHPGAPLVSPVAVTPVWRDERKAGLNLADRPEAVFDTLDDRSWTVLEDHFRTDTQASFDAIGQRFGVTGARMQQIEQAARRTIADAISAEPVLNSVASSMASHIHLIRPVRELIVEIPGRDVMVRSLGKPAWWVLGRFSEAYDIVDGWCGRRPSPPRRPRRLRC